MADVKQQVAAILAGHPRERGELLPILHETQAKFGYLPKEALQQIAREMKLAEATVWGVATFYADFKYAPVENK